jgi:hypothetical protein
MKAPDLLQADLVRTYQNERASVYTTINKTRKNQDYKMNFQITPGCKLHQGIQPIRKARLNL